ncbi:MAG: RidA family protein [Gammaproteobacteria bacterium]|nr:RidA family protein [Gammaproteobacteria bacterium]
MARDVISTDQAPSAIGAYSQATRAGNTVFISGQIPLDPATMEVVDGFESQVRRCFQNLQAICEASGGSLEDVVRVGIFMTDLSQFPTVNEVQAEFFNEPYPARATVEVSGLPKGVAVEVDAIMVLGD